MKDGTITRLFLYGTVSELFRTGLPKTQKEQMNQSLKNLSLWLVIVLVVIVAVSLLSPPKKDVEDVSYTEFLSLVGPPATRRSKK